MKSIEKKMALAVFWALLVIVLIFFGPLLGLDSASAQGSGQGGQALGLGVLGGLGAGTGSMMGLTSLNMLGLGLGMPLMGLPVIARTVSPSFTMGGSGSISMLPTDPGIMGGNPMLGLGASYPFTMYSSTISPVGGFLPYFGQFMPMGSMYPGMTSTMLFPGLYAKTLPVGYSGFQLTPYINEVSQWISRAAGGNSGVPYYYTQDGIVLSPLPPWVQWLQLVQPSPLLPIEVKGHVYDEETKSVLAGVTVALKNSGPTFSFVTDSNGEYVFKLFSDYYIFTYTRDGYHYKEVEVTVFGRMELVDVYLTPINHRPKLNPLPTIEVGAGETIILKPQNYASDPDGDLLTFEYSGFMNSNTYTTTDKDVGTHTVTIMAVDPGGLESTTQDVTIIIHKVNHSPKLNPLPPEEVIAGNKIILKPQNYASDPDGDPLTFKYSGFMNSNGYITTEEDIGTHTVTITAVDSGGLESISQDITINIYPGYEISLFFGFNFISYPFEDGDINFTAYDLLGELGGPTQVESVAYYDNITDQYISVKYDSNGEVLGEDFSIKIGQGYVVYAYYDTNKTVFNRYTKKGQYLTLSEGLNLIGIASQSEGYTSYDLLEDIGFEGVECIYRYDPFWGDWEFTYWLNYTPSGDVFPILMGEGYQIQMKKNEIVTLPRLRAFTF